MSNNNKNFQSGPRTKKRRLRKRIKVVLSIFVITFLAVFGYGFNLYLKADSAITDAYDDSGRGKSEKREEEVDPKVDNVTVLIIGVDENENDVRRQVGRTDALLLATFNRDDKSIKLLSIPRDSYVYIPHLGYEDKINHAYAFGGRNATIETVESLLDIPVDYYMQLNFQAFVEVVDAIGGVEVNVPYEIKEMDSSDRKNAIHLMEGYQSLNGEEALAFARTRKKDSDIERGKRQMEIIEAVIKKSTSLTSVFKYEDIIQAVGSNLRTNMTFSEMKSFVAYVLNNTGGVSVEKLTLEGENYQPGRIYYYKLDEMALETTIHELKRHLDLPTYVETDSESQNANGNLESTTY